MGVWPTEEMLDLTGSQWRETNMGEIGSRFLVPVSTLTAAFRFNWGLFNELLGYSDSPAYIQCINLFFRWLAIQSKYLVSVDATPLWLIHLQMDTVDLSHFKVAGFKVTQFMWNKGLMCFIYCFSLKKIFFLVTHKKCVDFLTLPGVQ